MFKSELTADRQCAWTRTGERRGEEENLLFSLIIIFIANTVNLIENTFNDLGTHFNIKYSTQQWLPGSLPTSVLFFDSSQGIFGTRMSQGAEINGEVNSVKFLIRYYNFFERVIDVKINSGYNLILNLYFAILNFVLYSD